jgi:LEA14-like dessication related protein
MTPPKLSWFLLIGLIGCDELRNLAPEVRFSRLEVDDISFEKIDAGFVFVVDNPHPIGFGLDRFTYAFELEGIELLNGTEPGGLSLPAGGEAEVRLPASLLWQGVYDTIRATRGEDDVGFGLSGDFGFDTRFGPVDIPYDAAGQFPALRTPKFSLGKLRVDNINWAALTATVALDLAIDNDHKSNLVFDQVDYRVRLANREVAQGLLPTLGAVSGASARTVSVPLTLNMLDVGQSIFDVIAGGSQINAGFDATMDVDTPFGVVPLTVNERGQVSIQR